MKINCPKVCSNAYFGGFRGGGHFWRVTQWPIPAIFYLKIQQTMQIQERSRISKVFTKPWIFLKVLESA